MEATKFRTFMVTLINGEKIITKAPASKLTEDCAKNLAYYWINKANRNNKLISSDIIEIVGIK